MPINKVVLASGTGDSEAAVAAARTLRLKGYSISEDAGSTASVKIYDGATIAAGVLAMAPLYCSANGTEVNLFETDGIPCPNGITVERVSGTTTVVLYVDKV